MYAEVHAIWTSTTEVLQHVSALIDKGAVYTTPLLYEYGDFSVLFTEEMQRLHIVVLSVEVNYAHGMWACHFW